MSIDVASLCVEYLSMLNSALANTQYESCIFLAQIMLHRISYAFAKDTILSLHT